MSGVRDVPTRGGGRRRFEAVGAGRPSATRPPLPSGSGFALCRVSPHRSPPSSSYAAQVSRKGAGVLVRAARRGWGLGRPAYEGRRGRSGAGAGLPPVSSFCQLQVMFLQLPVMGSAQGNQVVDIGGTSVVPVPQVMQLGAVDGSVAPDASLIPHRGRQPLRLVGQPLVASQPQHAAFAPEDDPARVVVRGQILQANRRDRLRKSSGLATAASARSPSFSSTRLAPHSSAAAAKAAAFTKVISPACSLPRVLGISSNRRATCDRCLAP